MNNARLAALTAFAAFGLTADNSPAQTRWIEDSMSVRCSPAARQHVAAAARRSIEERVARAESSIRAPGAIADMSCIESLLASDVDVFSGAFANVAGFDVRSLIGSLSGGLKSGLSSETITPGVARAICAHARERFETRTTGLTGSMEDIVAGFELPEFADGFGPPIANRTATRPARSSPAASSTPSRSPAPDPASLPQVRQAPAPAGGTGSEAEGARDGLRAIWDAIGGGSDR